MYFVPTRVATRPRRTRPSLRRIRSGWRLKTGLSLGVQVTGTIFLPSQKSQVCCPVPRQSGHLILVVPPQRRWCTCPVAIGSPPSAVRTRCLTGWVINFNALASSLTRCASAPTASKATNWVTSPNPLPVCWNLNRFKAEFYVVFWTAVTP